MSVLALIVGKDPPKLQRAAAEGLQGLVPGERGQMNFRRAPVVALVNTLSNILHTPVIDATGITGNFDFTLDPSQFPTAGGATPDSFGDLVVTAIQEQLGFKLEKRKASLEITIIDRAERPSEN